MSSENGGAAKFESPRIEGSVKNIPDRAMTALAPVTTIRPKTSMNWLSPAEVAARIPGMTVANLQELRKKRRGPAYAKPTLKTVVYAEADIDAWVARSRVATRDQS